MPIVEQLLYQTDKGSHRRCSVKKAVHKNFAIFLGKHLCWSLFWDEVEVKFAILLKRAFNRECSCEYCDISNNTCFEEYLHTPASENNKKRFLGKATGHNDHYMINMGIQQPKIGGNWLLTGPYLQRCFVFKLCRICYAVCILINSRRIITNTGMKRRIIRFIPLIIPQTSSCFFMIFTVFNLQHLNLLHCQLIHYWSSICN